jgi:hypothetical protein
MPPRLRRAGEQFPRAGWPVSDGHLVVLHGDRVIGTLREIDGRAAARELVLEHHTGCYVPPGIMTLYGTEGSKEAAKAAFGKAYRKWLEWAGPEAEKQRWCMGSGKKVSGATGEAHRSFGNLRRGGKLSGFRTNRGEARPWRYS